MGGGGKSGGKGGGGKKGGGSQPVYRAASEETPTYAESVPVSAEAQEAQRRQTEQARASYGSNSTVRTTPLGSATGTNNRRNTLLGQ